MKESLQSRIGKAQASLNHRQFLLAGNFSVFKKRMLKKISSPKALVVACIIGFLFGQYFLKNGLARPVKKSISPLIRASVISGYPIIWKKVLDSALSFYRLTIKSANSRQVTPDRDKS